MTLRDLFLGVIVWAIIVLIGVCAIAASNNARPIEIANTSSGAWDFNDASNPGIRDDAFVWLQICNPTYPRGRIRPVEKDRKVHQV